MREEVEGALREGESLSEFVETSVLEAARRRKRQQEFLARGRASLAKARESGSYASLAGVLDGMQERLQTRIAAHGSSPKRAAGKP